MSISLALFALVLVAGCSESRPNVHDSEKDLSLRIPCLFSEGTHPVVACKGESSYCVLCTSTGAGTRCYKFDVTKCTEQ